MGTLQPSVTPISFEASEGLIFFFFSQVG